MRFSIVLILFITSFQATASNAWQWQHECQVHNSNTKCSVWFNQQQNFDQIKVKSNGNLLANEQQSFLQAKSPSVNAILLHLKGVTQSQLLEIKKGLNKLIENKYDFQKFALYGSGEGLQILAPVGVGKEQLKLAISNVALSERIRNPVNDLLGVIDTLGGSTEKRKVVYWITVGGPLTTAQIAQIKLKMTQNKVRLVIMQLALSELSVNSFPALNQLSNTVSGLYSSQQYGSWVTSIANLANYSNNGTFLSINTQGLCGNKVLKFSTHFSGAEDTTTVTMAYPVCHSASSGSEGQRETGTEQQTNSGASEETTASPTDESSTTPEDGSRNANGETNTGSQEGADGTSTDGTHSGSSENTNTDVTTETETEANDEQDLTKVIISVVALALLLLLLILLMIKNKKKKENLNEQEIEQEKAIYGYLIVPASEGSRRIALTKVSSTMGRSQENDVIFSDNTVSGVHAQIKFERNGEVVLIDLKSSNGTYVNGEEITQQKLETGDDIMFGDFPLKFGG